MKETAEKNYGTEALEILDLLVKHHRWLYDQIGGYVGRRVLEIGAGRGHLTQFYHDKADLLWLTEYDPDCLRLLQKRYGRHAKKIEPLDLIASPPLEPYRSLNFDTALSCNVLEHLPDDGPAISWISSILPAGGKLILILSSHQFLFGAIDEYYGHYRRYSDAPLRTVLEKNRFKIIKSGYFGKVGAVAWYLKGKILRQAIIHKRDIDLKNLLFGISRLLEYLPLPFGHSLIMVAEKI